MRRLVMGWVLATISTAALAGETGKIEVRVDAIRNNDGQVFVSLFNKAEGFPGGAEAAIQTLSAKQSDGQATVTFVDVPYGDYAIAAYHDEDGNGKMKTVYGTIPVEGIGISRDAKGIMGPPKFADARFALNSAAITVAVSIKY